MKRVVSSMETGGQPHFSMLHDQTGKYVTIVDYKQMMSNCYFNHDWLPVVIPLSMMYLLEISRTHS